MSEKTSVSGPIEATPAADEGDVGADATGAQSRRGGRVRRATSTALTLLVLAATAFMLVVAYGTVVDNRWYKIVAIEGGSMAPAIHQGDAILVTKPPHTLQPGMIVLIQVESKLVTHRVVEVRADGSFVTKGDANDHVDDWSNVDPHVVGVVRGHLPLLGRMLVFGSGAWLSDRSDVRSDVDTG
jgi:signal peptidase I